MVQEGSSRRAQLEAAYGVQKSSRRQQLEAAYGVQKSSRRQQLEAAYGVKSSRRQQLEAAYGVQQAEPEGTILGRLGKEFVGRGMESLAAVSGGLGMATEKLAEVMPDRLNSWKALFGMELPPPDTEASRFFEPAAKSLEAAAPPHDPSLGLLGDVVGGVASGLALAPAAIGGPVGVGLAGMFAKGYAEGEAAKGRAIASGASPKAADRASWDAATRWWTVASGLSEGLTLGGMFGRAMSRANRKSGGRLWRLAKDMAGEGAQETGDEFVSVLNENLDAKDRKALGQLLRKHAGRLGRAGLVGTLAAGPISLVASAVEGKAPAKAQDGGKPSDPAAVLEALLGGKQEAAPPLEGSFTGGEPPLARGHVEGAVAPPPILSQTEEGRALLDRLAAQAKTAAPEPTVSPEAAQALPGEGASVAPAAPQEQAAQPEAAGATETALGSTQAEQPAQSLETLAFRAVDERLAAMGRDPSKHGERMSDQQALDLAEAAYVLDPHVGEKRLVEFGQGNRVPNKVDNAILLREMNRIGLMQQEAEQALLALRKGGTPSEISSQEQVVEALRDRYDKAADITTSAGTRSGQAHAFRAAMIGRDYSLAAYSRRARVENSRGAVPDEQLQQKVQELTDRVGRMERAYQEFVAGQDVKEAQREARTAAKTRKRLRALEKLSEAADAARERQKARGLRMYSLFDPAEFADEIIIGADYIAKGTEAFVDWSAAMVRDFGESIGKHLPAIYQQAQTKAAEARMADAKSDFRDRKERATSPEGIERLAAAERAKKQAQKYLHDVRAANRTAGEKAQAWTKDLATGGLRALQFGHDISVIFQQALVATLQGPKAAATKALPAAFKALTSEARMDRIDAGLRSRPLYQISTDAGLKLLDPDGPVSERAEFFASDLLRNVPTIAAFERAVTTYRNVIAATTFDSMYMAVPGTPTAEQAHDLAGAVNVFVGYGTGATAQAAASLNNVFNAPRLYVSQFQTLLSPFTLALSPLGIHIGVTARSSQVRRIIAGRIARALGGAAAMYALGVLAGGELEKDPRSSVGWRLVFTDKDTGSKTVLAPLGGLTTALTFLARLSGKTKDAETGRLRGTSFYDIYSFAGYKLAPWLGNGFSFAVGKTPMGDPYNFTTPEGLTTVAKSTFLPIAWSDIVENMEANGLPKGTIFQLLNALGQSVYVKENEGGSKGPDIDAMLESMRR